MQYATYANPCPGATSGMPGFLFGQLMQTLLSAQCLFGNPKDYPEDFGKRLRNDEEFDFVVVGGGRWNEGDGSSGSSIASRLSEVKKWRILLLEAGDIPTFESDIPGFKFSLHGSKIDWDYRSESSNESCLSMEGQSCRLPKGKALGGSSTLNMMHYIRGNAEDYDEWERLGNAGWKFEDVLPYFKKSEKLDGDFTLINETSYDKAIRALRKTVRGDDESTYEFSKLLPGDYHSTSGILPVNHFSYDFYLTTLKKFYCYAVNEIGLDCISDLNGVNQLGFVNCLGTVREGTRANTAKIFLNPSRSRPNLFVARKSYVRKIILKGNRAVGVSLHVNGKVKTVYARKEVILSAGTFNSPKILMLSGIGPEEHLRSLGIPVVRNAPGVGSNLQSHVTFFGFPVSLDRDLPDPLRLLQKFDGIYEFFTRGSGLYGNICMNDFVGFVATDEESALPDLQYLHFVNHQNDTYLFNEMFKALGFGHEISNQFANFTSNSRVMLVCPTVLRPASRGKVELRSATESDPPRIAANILSEKEDVETLLRGVRLAAKMMTMASFEKMQAEMLKLQISGCQNHKFDTGEYWMCLIRHLSSPLHDFSGTCKMGPEGDEMAVVDNTLKVRGIEGLRVADSSIMPNIVRGSTHVTAIMIGERVSDFIKEEWKSEHIHDEI